MWQPKFGIRWLLKKYNCNSTFWIAMGLIGIFFVALWQPESVIGWLKKLKNWIWNLTPLWTAFGSIGTCIMAWVTYKLLKHYREVDEERIRREIIENLIQPLITNLENEILSKIKYLSISKIWEWPILKQKHPYLVYRLPKSLKENIEKFHEELEKFFKLQNQCFNKLNQEIEKEILVKIKKEIGRDYLKMGSIGTYYFIEIGGKSFQIRFHELLFANRTLNKYIEKLKEDPTLPNKNVKKEYFCGDGVELKKLGRKDFQEIANNISKKVNDDSELKSFLDSCWKLKDEAENLKRNLSQENILKSDCES